MQDIAHSSLLFLKFIYSFIYFLLSCNDNSISNFKERLAVFECNYLWQSNWHLFLDVDECLVEGSCSHQCINIPGSFECVCQEEYQLINGTCKAKGKSFHASHFNFDRFHGYTFCSWTISMTDFFFYFSQVQIRCWFFRHRRKLEECAWELVNTFQLRRQFTEHPLLMLILIVNAFTGSKKLKNHLYTLQS